MQENQKPISEKRSKVWFWSLLGLAMIGLALGFQLSKFSSSLTVVHDQLEMIKAKHFTQGYYDYTSKAFQQKYSLSDFKNFLISHPPFADMMQFVEESEVESEQTANISMLLLSNGLEEAIVYYSLVKEENVWKIDEMELKMVKAEANPSSFSESEEQEEKPFVFHENFPANYVLERVLLTEEKKTISPEIKSITVGDEVDQIGLIKKARNVIDSNVNLLFFNVRIEHGQAGSLVSLFLKHVDSGATAAPLSTTLRKDGLTVATFSYAAPNQGWPIGDYTVKVTLETGQEKTENFQIRKGEREFY